MNNQHQHNHKYSGLIVGFFGLLGVVAVIGSLSFLDLDQTQVQEPVQSDTRLSGEGGIGATECDITTESLISFGDDVSTEILASYGRRAWARVKFPTDSTGVSTSGPVALGFDATAALGDGTVLSTSTPELIFGLNTDLPFTGAVNAITTNGSTSIEVIECRY